MIHKPEMRRSGRFRVLFMRLSMILSLSLSSLSLSRPPSLPPSLSLSLSSAVFPRWKRQTFMLTCGCGSKPGAHVRPPNMNRSDQSVSNEAVTHSHERCEQNKLGYQDLLGTSLRSTYQGLGLQSLIHSLQSLILPPDQNLKPLSTLVIKKKSAGLW